ncbi:MAG: AAA family ATPase, partial [Tannerella sp.]|nr:AAA family ATPase [Tannerella sp.]
MVNNRKLPVGIQDFEKLRTGSFVYVDKTAYVYRLAYESAPCFLGRPRRFGKSLLLSTLKAYFLGKKELFEGLAIAGLEKEWVEYPVFHLDMNLESYTGLASLESALDGNLRPLEAKWRRDPDDKSLSMRFTGLIRRACEQTGKKVVVLIDEYDKPLINTMEAPDVHDDIRKALKGFYGVLKSADTYLRFVMLTGVTKFSQVSVFSDLNHLQDISLNKDYAGICGISESELISEFEPELHALAEETENTYEETLAEMKKRYDGYHFARNSEGMYNPFSVLNTFSSMEFRDYWFKTGTPTFLVNLLKREDFDIRNLKGDVTIDARSITDYRPENNNPIPILYQSGYLTIKGYKKMFDAYVLGFPNGEVEYGFLHELLPAYAPRDMTGDFFVGNFIEDLMTGNVDAFMTRLRA